MKPDRFLIALQTSNWDNVVKFRSDVDPEIFRYAELYYQRTGQVIEVGALRQQFPELPFPTNTPFSFYEQELGDEIFVDKATPILERFNTQSQIDFPRALLQLRASLQEIERPKDAVGHSLKNSVLQRIEAFARSAPLRLRTGIEPLDNATGGLEQDEFFVISARLGIGKSWLGQFIAANVAKQGKKVLFYSGEMTTEQVGSRIDTIWAEGEISQYLYARNRLTPEERAVLQTKVSQVTGDVIVFTPKDLPTPSCRPSDVSRMMAVYEPDVVILDQISLMEPDGKPLQSDHERKAELSYQLKRLQSKNPIPFIIISQLNRGAQTEEATAANIAGSDRIGQDASLIVALKRPDSEKLVITVLKARSFNPQDSKMEFVWDVDRGKLSPVLSGMDAVRARASQAVARDSVRSREQAEEDLDSWEE